MYQNGIMLDTAVTATFPKANICLVERVNIAFKAPERYAVLHLKGKKY
jgi:hypothetical protein